MTTHKAASSPDTPPPGAAPADVQAKGLEITHFNFEHAVFKAPGARFLLVGLKRTPTFRVDMGDLEGLIEVDVVKKSFGIAAGSSDAKLMDLAVAGLRYVPDIKPGDEIPSEILSGKASWTVSPRHKKIAEQRLQVQLLSWVSGKEVLLTDPGEIGMFLQQIENREKLRGAFRDAAVALGRKPEDTEYVIKQLELLAREVCYVEALRDRFAFIPKLGDKLTELGKSYGNDRNGKMELVRVQGLLQTGINHYTAIFSQADAQTGEIIAALKSIDRQIRYIRQVRDDLHFLIMQWDPYIADLDGWQSRRTPETDKRLVHLYRFLATKFTAGRSMLKRREDPAAAKSKGGEKTAAARPAGNAPPSDLKKEPSKKERTSPCL